MTWPECAECHNSNILELHFELCEHTMSLSLKWHQKLFLLVLVAPSKQVFIFWIRTESILEQSQHIIYDVAQNILSIHGGNQVNEFLGWEQQESGISWTLPKAASWGKSNWSVPLKTKTKPQMYTLKPWAPNNEDSRCEAMQPRQWAPCGQQHLPGSVRQKAAMCSPEARRGRYLAFCSSVPAMRIPCRNKHRKLCSITLWEKRGSWEAPACSESFICKYYGTARDSLINIRLYYFSVVKIFFHLHSVLNSTRNFLLL